MILGAVFCPHPPLLRPTLAGAAATEVADLLASCDEAVATVLLDAPRIVVLGPAPVTARFDRSAPGSMDGFGPQAGRGTTPSRSPGRAAAANLPLSLATGCWLLERAGVRTEDVRLIGLADRPDDDAELAAAGPVDDAALLVMGDGSARRGLKAPGYLDPRAVPFDDRVAAAVGAGDAFALAALDPALAADLLAAGAPAWRAAGRMLSGQSWSARVLYDADPYGVSYRVATWLPAQPPM